MDMESRECLMNSPDDLKHGNHLIHHVRVIGLLAFIGFLMTFYILSSQSSRSFASVGREISVNIIEERYVGTEQIADRQNQQPEGRVNSTGYLVYSPSCHMPDTPPFHESIKHLYQKLTEPPCSTRPPLTTVSKSLSGNVLYLHKELYARYKVDNATCCYSRVWRPEPDPSRPKFNPDNNVSFGKCKIFYGNVTLNSDDEFIKVKCAVEIRQTKYKYNNMHAFVGWKPQVGRKMWDADQKSGTSKGKTLNVMIIGLDTVSRKNLIRTMPKTVEYLDSSGWIDFKGYNKVGSNTLPNVLATLAGMTEKQIRDKCWPTNATPMDDCPLIWKDFSQKGYITVYAEDEPKISTFNYHKAGFREPPTDYYLRPFMKAAHKIVTKKYNDMAGCIGPLTPTQHILNYSINIATTFIGYPTFSLYWLNGMHQDLNRPTTIDDLMRRYFEKDLKDCGALNTTMVIFLSDHGIRWGKIRETYVGHIEERLPFLYFWLPEWFKSAHPVKLYNMIKNTNRLTSPYDIYVTLADVLGVDKTAEGCPECVSLFKEVPWNRSCTDAGIPEHWCTCTETIPTKDGHGPGRAMAEFVVQVINNILKQYDSTNGTRCAILEVHQVVSVRSKIFSKTSGFEEFVIIVQTSPGNATFEATVSHKSTYEIVDSISRISSYGEQSDCVDNYYAKNYCYCEKVTVNTSSTVSGNTTATNYENTTSPTQTTSTAAGYGNSTTTAHTAWWANFRKFIFGIFPDT